MSGDINIVIIIELSNSLAFFITLFEYLRNLNSIITFGNGKFVVAEGYRGNTQTTTDGVTWTTPNTSSGNHNWQDIAAGNGKFILVGNSGYIATSTDGITWAPTQIKDEAGSPVTLILYGVGATQ